MSDITLSPLLGNTSLRREFPVILTETGPELLGDEFWAECGDTSWIDLGVLIPPGDKALAALAGQVARRIPEQGAIGTLDAILDATLEIGAAVGHGANTQLLNKVCRAARRRLECPTLGAPKSTHGHCNQPDTPLRQITRAAAVGVVAAAKSETGAIRDAAWAFHVVHYLSTHDNRDPFVAKPVGARDTARAVAELLAARIVHAAFINPKMKIPPSRQAHIMECGLVRDGIFPSGFSLDAAGEGFL